MTVHFDLDAYLGRIGYGGPLEATPDVLAALQSAHVNAIPFEGLDRLMRLPVKLDIGSLQSKIVAGRRGGNCFELNGLFQAALERIGFAVRALGARVRWMSAPDSPMGPREHMLLLVELADGPRIVDVGFGACLIDAPLAFEVGAEQRTPMGTYRLSLEDGVYFLNAKQPTGWRTAYAFGLERQYPADFEMANAFAPLNPRLPFLSNLVAERVTADRRYKLINRMFLTEARDGELVAEQPVASAEVLGRLLETQLGIQSPVPVEDLFRRTPGEGS